MNWIKKLTHFLIMLGMLAGLGYVLWIGLSKQETPPGEDTNIPGLTDTPVEEEEMPESFVVTLDSEQVTTLGLEYAKAEPMTQQIRRLAYGSVLDPSPLMALHGDLKAAEAAMSASKAENVRTLALVATNDASQKYAEASEALFVADQIKVERLLRDARFQWGDVFNSDTTIREPFIDALASGSTALIRVDVMPGDALAELPKNAQILAMGREGSPIIATSILPAATTDPRTQAEGFVLVAKPPFALRPGMAVTAWLELAGEPRPGFAIPRAAILRHDGHTWVYTKSDGEDHFTRKRITLDTPLDADPGWFVTAGSGVTADDLIVIVGASSLLSEELKAQGGGEPE